ncbi:LysR family transcriptional regulator [Psychromonas sp. psych-6C06]|uniref:LysR family transcriptional regulator n=1 Tax=Psychromonas sp. psych-6C06 TaxID=2058089 RepID=UPI000C33E6EB|nr:LysR family transcriptional regulator [Psychromonas sp. psych-6C06]PKF63457.1 LysR family transcriptional regulator [Psychromonas sp. psych-6C06]
MNITLKQLQVFICITQEKTMTAAAEKLFLSKPAVSMSLAELEKQLGHPLFERKNNRLFINDLGKQLLPLADEQIERSKLINTLFSDKNQLNGKLAIGASNTLGNHLLPFLLSDFRKQFQLYDQSLLIDNSQTISEQIKEYELDIGLVEANLFDSEITSVKWLQDEMVIVCHSGHPLNNKKYLTIEDLENQQWILREQGSGTRAFFLNKIGCKLSGYHISLELKSTEAIINSTSAGLGLACISKVAARHALADKRLKQLIINVDMHRDYWLIWHKDRYQSPLIKTFIDFAKQWQQPF